MSNIGIVVVFSLVMLLGYASSAKFEELYQPGWALDHFVYEGEVLKLKLDQASGKIYQI